jgi:hypothetical protein
MIPKIELIPWAKCLLQIFRENFSFREHRQNAFQILNNAVDFKREILFQKFNVLVGEIRSNCDDSESLLRRIHDHLVSKIVHAKGGVRLQQHREKYLSRDAIRSGKGGGNAHQLRKDLDVAGLKPQVNVGKKRKFPVSSVEPDFEKQLTTPLSK